MIHLIVTAGLGNRMRSMASAIALGRDQGRPVRVDWCINDGCNAPFRSLFRDIPGVRVDDVRLIRPGPLGLLSRGLTAVRLRCGYYDLVLGDEAIVAGVREGSIAGLFAGHRRVFVNTFHRFWGDPPFYPDFILADDVQRIVDAETRRIGTEYVGVHVRRTDHVRAIESSPLDAFVTAMRRSVEERDSTFFLATDDGGVEEALRREFPGRIATSARTRARDTPEGMRDGLVDLAMLSRSRSILGSYWSSFSRTAAEWGGIEEITIVSPGLS